MLDIILLIINIFIVYPIYIYTTYKCFNKDTKKHIILNTIISPPLIYVYTLIIQSVLYLLNIYNFITEIITIILLVIIFMNLYSKINNIKDSSKAFFIYNSFILIQFTITSCVQVDNMFTSILTILVSPIIIIHGYYEVVTKRIHDIINDIDNKQGWKMNLLPITAEAILIANIYMADYSKSESYSSIGFFIISYLILIFDFLAFYLVIDNTRQKINVIALNKNLLQTQRDLIVSLSEAIEEKSEETGVHVHNVAEYTRILCEHMGYSKEKAEEVALASMLHDVGKISIPDNILNKPCRLTNEEFSIIKTHVTAGEKIIHNMNGQTMEIAKVIALEHHERWDGNGYLKMKPENTHQVSRIVALADVWDALCSPRIYKEPWDREKAKKLIIEERGKQFDPEVVDAFVNGYDEFCKILDESIEIIEKNKKLK